jgi:hypothetical protein
MNMLSIRNFTIFVICVVLSACFLPGCKQRPAAPAANATQMVEEPSIEPNNLPESDNTAQPVEREVSVAAASDVLTAKEANLPPIEANLPSEAVEVNQLVAAAEPEQHPFVSEADESNEPVEPNADRPVHFISGDAFNLKFRSLLRNFVDSNGLVDYAKLRRMKIELNDAVESFADLKPEIYIVWSRNEKIAFWLNAHNILTLKGITDNYPIKTSRFRLLLYPPDSIMHIAGLRDKMFFNVMGIQYTLMEIQRDMLLGRFGDPRIIFALSDGTLSSAALRNEPYLGRIIDRQLDGQAGRFIARPDGFRMDTQNNIVYLSGFFKIYSWYEDAFLKTYGDQKRFRQLQPVDKAILNCIANYISEINLELLLKKQFRVEYVNYDWRLNAQAIK